MAKKMLIDATHPEETRVVVVDGTRVEEFDYESITKVQIAGNIYLAKITRVEPALHAAFVDYGGNRHGFLAFAEIHPDYYQIPVADREALLAAERAEAEREARLEARQEARQDARRNGRSEKGEAERAASGDSEERRRGRRRQKRRGRRDGEPRGEALGLRPAAEDAAIQAGALERAADLAANGQWIGAPTPLANDQAGAPDLSDVTEVRIRRLATEAEAAETGREVIEERIALPAAAPEDAGANLRDTLRGAPVLETDNTPGAESDAESEEDDEAAFDSDRDMADPDGADEIEEIGDADGVEDEDDALEAGDDRDGDESGGDTKRSRRPGRWRARRGERRGGSDAEDDAADDSRSASRSEIEEVGAEDARDEIRPRAPRMRDYKIQEVIKRRQIMLVQVVKEERGTKGAALTTYLSLAGRYCVLMPNTARGGGISRKITNAADRKRLKAVAQEMEVPEGMGLIVRTAGANRTKAEIKRDYEYLLRQWSSIRELTLQSVAPTLIYEEGSLIKRTIRDLYNRDIDEVLVEGEDGYREAKDYMKMLMPSHAKNVQPYREQTPLFIRYQVETQMSGMLQPTVQLKSGGYIVIGVTEALVAVDVNSGRSTKESSIEETALKTNLEAAEEVARQMKLRDLAGLIVIDFIDMEEPKNNRAVEKRLKDKLKTDRARIQLGRISGFGLLEMSRQRLRPGLLETTTVCCPHCKGAGVIRSDESLALSILRAVEEEGVRGRTPALRVAAPVQIANYLINQKRARVIQIEARYDLQVIIEGDPVMVSPNFAVEKVKPLVRDAVELRRAVQIDAGFDAGSEEAEPREPEQADGAAREAEAQTDSGDRDGRRRRREGREEDVADAAVIEAAPRDASARRDDAADMRRDDSANAPRDASEDSEQGDEEDGSTVVAESAADEASRKRRGRRGGRRRRKSENGDGDPLPVIDLDEEAAAAGAAEEPPAIANSTGEGRRSRRRAADRPDPVANGAADDAHAEPASPPDATARPAEPDVIPQLGEISRPVEIATPLEMADADEPEAAAEAETPPAEETIRPAEEMARPAEEPVRPTEPATVADQSGRRTGWWASKRQQI